RQTRTCGSRGFAVGAVSRRSAGAASIPIPPAPTAGEPAPVAAEGRGGARWATTDAARHADGGVSAAPATRRIIAAMEQATSGESLRMAHLAIHRGGLTGGGAGQGGGG